jgi:hypothetical protein
VSVISFEALKRPPGARFLYLFVSTIRRRRPYECVAGAAIAGAHLSPNFLSAKVGSGFAKERRKRGGGNFGLLRPHSSVCVKSRLQHSLSSFVFCDLSAFLAWIPFFPKGVAMYNCTSEARFLLNLSLQRISNILHSWHYCKYISTGLCMFGNVKSHLQ